MITLLIESYCHDCCEFNPVMETERIISDRLIYEGNKIVKCEHADLCRYLTDRFKKELVKTKILKEDSIDGESEQESNGD